jgi:hypothetical protein
MVRCPVHAGDLFSFKTPSLLFSGYQGLFPSGIKRSRRDANHSLPSSAYSVCMPPMSCTGTVLLYFPKTAAFDCVPRVSMKGTFTAGLPCLISPARCKLGLVVYGNDRIEFVLFRMQETRDRRQSCSCVQE